MKEVVSNQWSVFSREKNSCLTGVFCAIWQARLPSLFLPDSETDD